MEYAAAAIVVYIYMFQSVIMPLAAGDPVFQCPSPTVRTCHNCKVQQELCKTTVFPVTELECSKLLLVNSSLYYTTYYGGSCWGYTCELLLQYSLGEVGKNLYMRSCNAGCPSITLSTQGGVRIDSQIAPTNITYSITGSTCSSFCIEIAHSGIGCSISYYPSTSECWLYAGCSIDGSFQNVAGWRTVAYDCDFKACTKLPDPANGGVTFSGLVEGSTATFSCKQGYILSDPSILLCQADGTWNGTVPTCNFVDCGTPPSILNGQMSFVSTTYQSTITYTCDAGYVLNHPSVLACQADSTWNGTDPTCSPVDCGIPIPPTNGHVTALLTTYLKNATFICDSGYNISGVSSSTCQADGIWSGTSRSCVPVDCGQPSSLTNGQVQVLSTLYLQTVTYTCNPGYIISGQSLSTCQSNGSWSGAVPLCHLVSCGAPQIPANGQVIAPLTTFLATALYMCDLGYLLVGSDNVTCLANASWSGPPPSCQIIDCGPLASPNNGQVTALNTAYLFQAQYACNYGFRLKGQNTSECLLNASWSDPPPSCIFINCSIPQPPSNGWVNFTATALNGQANYGCDSGFTLTGPGFQVCQYDNTWNGTDPMCVTVDCGLPGSPLNGSVTVSATTYMNTAEFSCDEGFLLVGDNTSLCQANGSWTILPVCDPIDCGIPSSLLNVSVFFVTTTFTSAAVYKCSSGFKLYGANVSECLSNGTWSRAEPNCTLVGCGTLKHPANGSVILDKGTDVGAVASYSCNSGLKLSYSTGRICLSSGEWTGMEPTCDVPERPIAASKVYLMPCICYFGHEFEGLTMDEIIAKLEGDMRIEPKETLQALDKLICRSDRRTSSTVVGMVGVFILISAFGVIILIDLVTVVGKICTKGKQ